MIAKKGLTNIIDIFLDCNRISIFFLIFNWHLVEDWVIIVYIIRNECERIANILPSSNYVQCSGLGIYKRKKKVNKKLTTLSTKKKELVVESKIDISPNFKIYFFLGRERIFFTIIVFSWTSSFFRGRFLGRERVLTFYSPLSSYDLCWIEIK